MLSILEFCDRLTLSDILLIHNYEGGPCMKEQLINSILQFLSGKLPDEDITELRLQLYYQLADYQISKKCTDLTVMPEKTYMDYLYMWYRHKSNHYVDVTHRFENNFLSLHL